MIWQPSLAVSFSSSATGMKFAGDIQPLSGCFHRASASNPYRCLAILHEKRLEKRFKLFQFEHFLQFRFQTASALDIVMKAGIKTTGSGRRLAFGFQKCSSALLSNSSAVIEVDGEQNGAGSHVCIE